MSDAEKIAREWVGRLNPDWPSYRLAKALLVACKALEKIAEPGPRGVVSDRCRRAREALRQIRGEEKGS